MPSIDFLYGVGCGVIGVVVFLLLIVGRGRWHRKKKEELECAKMKICERQQQEKERAWKDRIDRSEVFDGRATIESVNVQISRPTQRVVVTYPSYAMKEADGWTSMIHPLSCSDSNDVRYGFDGPLVGEPQVVACHAYEDLSRDKRWTEFKLVEIPDYVFTLEGLSPSIGNKGDFVQIRVFKEHGCVFHAEITESILQSRAIAFRAIPVIAND